MDLTKLIALEYSPGQDAFHIQPLSDAIKDSTATVGHYVVTGVLKGDPYFIIGVYDSEAKASLAYQQARPIIDAARKNAAKNGENELSNVTIGELLKQIGK